jgi:mono/diheme cytochrome c family protein
MSILAAALLALALPAASRADGRALFESHGCAACHRVGPRGGSAGPDLTFAGLRRPRPWIEQWLESPRRWKPSTLMPQQGLSAPDRAELAYFLSSQQGQAWGDGRPWTAIRDEVARGREIYLRAGCVACHGPEGRGGQPNPGAPGDVIPALAPLMGTYLRWELKRRIRNGAAAQGRDGLTPAVDMPPWKDALSDGELDALSTYLLSLAETQPKSEW